MMTNKIESLLALAQVVRRPEHSSHTPRLTTKVEMCDEKQHLKSSIRKKCSCQNCNNDAKILLEVLYTPVSGYYCEHCGIDLKFVESLFHCFGTLQQGSNVYRPLLVEVILPIFSNLSVWYCTIPCDT